MELINKIGIGYVLNGLFWGLIFNISSMTDGVSAFWNIVLSIVLITIISSIIFYFLARLSYYTPWIAHAKKTTDNFSHKPEGNLLYIYLITKYFFPYWPALYVGEIIVENMYPKVEPIGLLTELFGRDIENVNIDLQWKIEELEKMKNVEYEFDDDEAEKIWVFGNKLTILALLMAITAIIGIFTSLALFGQGDDTRPTVLLFEFVFLIIIAVVLFRPSDNFKRVATSEGRDMDELLEGLKEFKFAFTFSAIMIVIIGISNFILILSKI